jgi:hypothetical protein
MRSEVIVQLDADQEFRINLEALTPMSHEAARRWLDEQFVQLECEPLRATGKLLTADRVLCVAQAAGAQRLGNSEWSQAFARAASASLGKPAVRIDVAAMTVTY